MTKCRIANGAENVPEAAPKQERSCGKIDVADFGAVLPKGLHMRMLYG
jgi:hypothetical protein